MTTIPQEARHARCQRCGAGFPIPAIAPSVACPYCGNVQPLPPEIAQQLAQYQQEMAARAASVQANDRASAKALRADAEVGAIFTRGSWVGYVVMCGPAFVLEGGVWLLTQIGLLRGPLRAEVEGVTQLLAGIVTVIGMVGYSGESRGAEERRRSMQSRRSRTVDCDAHPGGSDQSIGSLPASTSARLIVEKGLLPKNPLRAESGEGCTPLSTVWRVVSMSLSFFCA
jgi:hypothetical protein